MPAGRFAPSPSGDLHLGNLRTALLAWLFARSTGRRFLIRLEDLDRVQPGAAERQLADLAAIGLDWDGDVVHQSQRLIDYRTVLDELSSAGRTYECYCSRKEILQAPSAPHVPPGAYPGTCRNLSDRERARRRADNARPATRLRSAVSEFTVIDELHGSYTGAVDDFVLRRGDGTPAYNLAVVVDDAAQGIDQVVRGDDLLASSPRQAYLADLLGHPVPRYAHVPLMLNKNGSRLAKRDGAVTLADRIEIGETATQVAEMLAATAGLPGITISALLPEFEPSLISLAPWTFVDGTQTATRRSVESVPGSAKSQ